MKGCDTVTPEILNQYYDRIYGYAHRHTFNEEEAADLTQDILYTVLTQLPTLKNEAAFEGWLWSIAANVTRAFRRKMGRQRAMFVYDMPEDMIWEDEYPIENEELYASLRARVAGLSQRYRDIVIMYYYDSLSTKEIAARLDIPEGTVTWRLSEARKKLKKECETMKAEALRPQKINPDIYGTGDYDDNCKPFPYTHISDALSQNILYHCYEKAQTVESLSDLCGVPAYYIEDCMDNLLKREAIKESGGKYRTDFLIWSDKYGIYCEKHGEECMKPVLSPMLAALDAIAEDAKELDFYRAGKSEDELYYLYALLAISHMNTKYSRLPYPEIREKYDGYRWCYIGNTESGTHKKIGIGIQCSMNLGSGGTYSHTVYAIGCGFAWRQMMFDYEINVCEDLLTRGQTDDAYSAAEAIRRGYIRKTDSGDLHVTPPAFTKEQIAVFRASVERHTAPIEKQYQSCIDAFLKGYRALFPAHLPEDADRMCAGIYTGMITILLAHAQRIGHIQPPPQDSVCDVIIQFK